MVTPRDLRQRRRIAHDVGGDAEGRARRNHHLSHRSGTAVVVGLDQPLCIGEDFGIGLDHRVGRKTSVTFAKRHRSSRGVETQTDFLCCFDFVVKTRIVWEQIQVIECGRASGQRKLSERQLGGNLDVFGCHPGPDRVQGAQPVEQSGVLRSRDRSGQRLVEVVVSVDETRQDKVSGKINNLVCRIGQVDGGANLLDEAVLDEHAAVGDFSPRIIHRRYNLRMLDQ